MNTANIYLEKLRAFALGLAEDAERMDANSNVLVAWYARFAAAELHVGWSPRQPLTGREFCEALAILAESSGAFGFAALQQFVANLYLGTRLEAGSMEAGDLEAGDLKAGEAWPCVGVAFGHLRNPQGAAPHWDGAQANGFIPWLTGAACFPHIVLGMRGHNEEEVYALVASADRAAFRHSAPMDLIAGAGTRTVSVRVSGLPVAEGAILKRDPPGTLALGDAQGVLYQTPLIVGCIRACGALIGRSSRISSVEQARCQQAIETLLNRVYTAFEGCTAGEGQRLRAEVSDFAVRLTRLAAMSCGGASLARPHPAQRLYREALLYALMAQTDAIVQQAFEEVFG